MGDHISFWGNASNTEIAIIALVVMAACLITVASIICGKDDK